MVSSTPRPQFTPGKDTVPILQEAGWAPGPVWTGGKSRPHRDSILDRPARSSVAIPTELPGPRNKHEVQTKIQYSCYTNLRPKRSQNCENRPLVSSCFRLKRIVGFNSNKRRRSFVMSVRLSARTNSARTGQIFMRFYI